MQNALRRNITHLTASAATEIVPAVILAGWATQPHLNSPNMSRLLVCSAQLCLFLSLLPSLKLAELTLPAITIMLVSSRSACLMGMCQTKHTAGLTTRPLGASSKWMSILHQGTNFTPRLSWHENPLGIRSPMVVSGSWFCLNRNVKHQADFRLWFCQPSVFQGLVPAHGIQWPLTWKHMIFIPVKFMSFRAFPQTTLEYMLCMCSLAQVLSFITLLIK